MKKIGLLFVYCMFGLAAWCQNAIGEYEYWFDKGYSNKTVVPITPAATFQLNTNISFNGLTHGLHTFNIRFKDTTGKYTETVSRYVFKNNGLTSGNNLLQEYEYWFDKDYSNKTVVSITTAATFQLNTNISFNSFPHGLHTFNIRFKDTTGKYTETVSRYVFKNNGLGPSNLIQEYEYWFDNDYANKTSQVLSVPVSPAALTFQLDLDSMGVACGYRNFHARFKDTYGRWSAVVSDTIFNDPIPVADFAILQYGGEVFFNNHSMNAQSYFWDFGDGTTDTTQNAYHHYEAGYYSICMVATTGCKQDTFCKYVTVQGLTSIHSNVGGNVGAITTMVRGGGFTPATQITLVDGGNVITPDTMIFINTGLLQVTYNLIGQTVGVYDVVADFNNGSTDTLYNGFTVIAPSSSDPDLWVNISGSNFLRIDWQQKYHIIYGNNSSFDANMVPIIVSGLPLGTTIQLMNDTLSWSNFSPFDTLPNLPFVIEDSLENHIIFIIFVPRVAANSAESIELIFNIPQTIPAHTPAVIDAVIGDPLMTNDYYLRASLSQIQECLGFMMGKLGFSSLEEAVTGLDPTGWAGCAISAGQQVGNVFNYVKDNIRSNQKFIINGSQVLGGLTKIATNCYEPILGAAIPELGVIGVGKKTIKSLERLMHLNGKLHEFLDDAEDVIDFKNKCGDAFSPNQTGQLPLDLGYSWDPNQKYGLFGPAGTKHLSHITPLNYTVMFENDSTATLPAQRVIIRDTLDKTKIDFSTFQLNTISIGDSTYYIFDRTFSYVGKMDLAVQVGYDVGIHAQLDTVTGALYVEMNTLEPGTYQITENPAAGFLPPRTVYPVGMGSISYSVNPKTTIQHGDSVKNQAGIYFDNNPVVLTDEWVNVYDFVKPSSQLIAQQTAPTDSLVQLSVTGSDDLSGIWKYVIYFTNNDTSAYGIAGVVYPSNPTLTFDMDTLGEYKFYSIAVDNAGNFENKPLTADDSVTYISTDIYQPVEYQTLLLPCRPNPATNYIDFPFQLGSSQNVELVLLDVLGREVASITNTKYDKGKHIVRYSIQALTEGIYFYQFRVGNELKQTRKVIIEK